MIEDTGNNVIKDFLFIIDPRSLPYLNDTPSRDAATTLKYLRAASGINIELVLPRYISDNVLPKNSAIAEALKVISEAPPSDFQLHKAVEKKILEDFKKLPDMGQESSLLTLSESMTADGIVTDSDLLIKYQYVIYQHHRIRIVPVAEFLDMIRVIAVGNSVFWSTAYGRDIGFDIFYQMTHWKASRLLKWWSQAIREQTTKELVENLRAALLNRFPYILYSRDMVRFYQFQRDYYVRRHRLQMYGLAVGFYINTFYLMLWGMLEHLTVVAKYARDLRVDERSCGIRSRRFWKEFCVIENGLSEFVKAPKMAEWIGIMAYMRHQAAHNVILIPSVLLFDTDDSKKTDDEIIEILRKEKPHLYRFFDAEFIEAQQPMWIADWRMKKMEIGAPSMVVVSKPDGKSYMRDPVISVDYDLSYLVAVMDAFLVKLFN